MIPTAEEIFSKHLESMLKRTDQSYCSIDEMKAQPEWNASVQAMIEFARLHVEAALQEANKKATMEYGDKIADGHYERFVDKDSILNSYPLDNVK